MIVAVHIKIPQPWDIPEHQITPEALYWNRRQILRAMGLTGVGLAGVLTGCKSDQEVEQQILQRAQALPTLSAAHNDTFSLDRPLTEEKVAAHYNNFYEFSSRKADVWELADFESEPWKVEITGLVQRPQILDIDDIRRLMPLEERHYRFRCVEAWAMAVPWIGFPMRALLERVEPLAKARFVRLTTFHFQDGRQSLLREYPWPYNEGLSMAEAMHELTLLAVGIYGHTLPPQHGAPLRLVTPWKYGFKSIKSVARIELTETQPATFWNTLVPSEYDFLANVNPNVPHPRWSQATERLIGSNERRPTLLYNGYGAYVAPLYTA
jgi:sulfoxide reductase catalytic subunit YedY